MSNCSICGYSKQAHTRLASRQKRNINHDFEEQNDLKVISDAILKNPGPPEFEEKILKYQPDPKTFRQDDLIRGWEVTARHEGPTESFTQAFRGDNLTLRRSIVELVKPLLAGGCEVLIHVAIGKPMAIAGFGMQPVDSVFCTTNYYRLKRGKDDKGAWVWRYVNKK